MDFKNFGLSRDLLYLCSLFLGSGAASFLRILRKDCTIRKKSFLITALLCQASCVVALLAASIILSRGLIFGVSIIYPFIGLFFVLGGLAVYFPRAGGYPAIFFAGLCTVYICFSFLAYPGLKEPEQLAARATGTGLVIKQKDGARDIDTSFNGDDIIGFEAVCVTANPAYPLIGGERRGLITCILGNREELFSFYGKGKKQQNSFRGSWGSRYENFYLELPVRAMPPGIGVKVLFDGKQLYFDPPVQL